VQRFGPNRLARNRCCGCSPCRGELPRSGARAARKESEPSRCLPGVLPPKSRRVKPSNAKSTASVEPMRRDDRLTQRVHLCRTAPGRARSGGHRAGIGWPMLSTTQILTFGDFRFDTSTRELSRSIDIGSSKPIPLGSRAAELLLLFLRRPGDLVTKNEIMDAVWPNTACHQQFPGRGRHVGHERDLKELGQHR
jgi:hypothetical protein